ncbi:hypothetical protein [Catenulispora pinisilvae]|uniref:hypothetical protein n=1 Tax=Catenulispora pinisilvae TaxID=2705253 RepID=UPI001891B12B|nr:hypothetical protein [Catenulispora pinisilvae]
MSTPSTTADATSGCSVTVAQTLLADGWTYTQDIATDPGGNTQLHQLASPDRALTLNVHDVSGGLCFGTLTAPSVRTGGTRRRFWSAQFSAPLPIALAAITTAHQATTTPQLDSVEALLTAAGWHERHDEPDEDLENDYDEDDWDEEDEDGPQIRTWTSPDGDRWVIWCGPDNDPAFWDVDCTKDGSTRARLTRHTPAAVITALALTNHPDDDPDHAAPTTAPVTSDR